jgi:hypothetical protein
LVEKIFRKRSKSSTFVVASSISLSFDCALLEKIDPAAPMAAIAAADFISERRESEAAGSVNSVDGGLSIPALQLHDRCDGLPVG